MSLIFPWTRWRRWRKQIRMDAAFWKVLRCSHESPPKSPPNLDELRTLLQAGANVNSSEPSNAMPWLTPLVFTARRNHCTVETVRFLLENGADIKHLDRQNESGISPLTWAANGGEEKKNAKFRLLFEAGANVNARDENLGRTVVWEMTVWASGELIEDALRRGAALNNRRFNSLDWEPLHLAAYIGRAEVVELYLFYGADPSARDKNGQTPRMLAEQEESLCYSRDGHTYRREPDPRHENHTTCVRLLLAAEQESGA